MLDIFADDAFSRANLTEVINTVPYEPKLIGSRGIFETKNPNTPVAFIERKGTRLSLIPSKPRGSGETTKRKRGRRDLLPIAIPHFPYDDDLLPSALVGIREFGTEDQLEMASGKMAELLTEMRLHHEITHEWLRLGAIKGIVLDCDEAFTELVDLFDAFDITQEEFYFDLEGNGEALKGTCLDVIEYMETQLGGQTYDHIHAFVGKTFFRNLVMNDEVTTLYNEQTNFKWGAVQQGTGTVGRGTNQVTFGDITFECYRGGVGAADFIDADRAHFFPVGVPGIFQQHFAPAETWSDVNTPGREIYAMQEPIKFDGGSEVHTESNPLMICTRPKLLVLGHSGTEEEPS